MSEFGIEVTTSNTAANRFVASSCSVKLYIGRHEFAVADLRLPKHILKENSYFSGMVSNSRLLTINILSEITDPLKSLNLIYDSRLLFTAYRGSCMEDPYISQ